MACIHDLRGRRRRSGRLNFGRPHEAVSLSWQDFRFAPSAGSVLCALEAIPDGCCKELVFGHGEAACRLLLYRLGTRVRGYVNLCPHFSLPLNARPGEFLLLHGERVMCAWHCAVFSLEDGHCDEGPARGMSLQRLSIEVVKEQIVLVEGLLVGQ